MSIIKLDLGDVSRDPDALRERSATALERGLAFVDATGDELSKLRARVTLQVEPASRVVEWLSAQQSSDGAFLPLGLAGAGGLGMQRLDRPESRDLLGALEALSILADLSALHASCVESAAKYLEAVQASDGGWGSDALSESERYFATGMLAGLLGRTRYARQQVLDRASAFVDGLWSPKRIVQSDWETLAASALCYTNVHTDRSDEVLPWCGRELERAFKEERFSALAAARVLMYCSTDSLPGADFEPAALLAAILQAQGERGGFASGIGAGSDEAVAPTLDAMRALLILCGAL